jgi:hypothetical protein
LPRARLVAAPRSGIPANIQSPSFPRFTCHPLTPGGSIRTPEASQYREPTCRTPNVFPTRMRALGTGWTDGMGHIGAWGGVITCGWAFAPGAPLNWIILITFPARSFPAS